MMNFYKITTIGTVLLITGCVTTSAPSFGGRIDKESTPSQTLSSARTESSSEQPSLIVMAEQKATPEGRAILATGRQMIEDELILPGGCWDYINEVYNRAGYPNQRSKRQTIFKGTKARGPYADISQIQPGDFLYYINHSYGDIEHSAIFVDWVDYDNKQALMLSYGGENRRQPARYLPYDLSHVYRIIRAKN
jgi:hypothetical protein